MSSCNVCCRRRSFSAEIPVLEWMVVGKHGSHLEVSRPESRGEGLFFDLSLCLKSMSSASFIWVRLRSQQKELPSNAASPLEVVDCRIGPGKSGFKKAQRHQGSHSTTKGFLRPRTICGFRFVNPENGRSQGNGLLAVALIEPDHVVDHTPKSLTS